VVCGDAMFGGDVDIPSPIDYLAPLRHCLAGKAHVLHWGRKKSHRMCRSSMATELSVFADGFDIG